MIERLRRLRQHRLDHPESGFTLPELLITIVITAILVSAIATSLIVVLKSSDAQGARLDESHDSQQLALYYPTDIAGAANVDITVGSASTCYASPPSPGAVKYLGLTTSDPAGPFVEYWVEGTALMRHRCTGLAAITDSVMLIEFLEPGSFGITLVADGSFRIHARSTVDLGFDYDFTATPRVLDNVTGNGGSGPGGGGPDECTFQVGGANPNPVLRSASGALVNAGGTAISLALSVTTTGPCTALSAAFTPGAGAATAATLTETSPGSGVWTATIASAAHVWTIGPKTFTITDNGTTIGSFQLTVNLQVPPCAFVAGSAAPTMVILNNGNVATSSTVFTFTTTGNCLAPVITMTRGSGNSLAVPAIGGPTNWSATFPTAGWTITPATKVATISEGATSLGTFNVLVQRACVMVLNSFTFPSSTITMFANGVVASPPTVGFLTFDPCPAPSVQLTPGRNNPVSIPMTPFLGVIWSAVLPSSGWTLGTKTATIFGVVDQAGNPVTFTVTVVQACTFVPGGGGPDISIAGSTAVSSRQLTYSTTGTCATNLTPDLRITRGGGGTTETHDSDGGPPSWISDPFAAGGWTAGTKTVTFVNNAGVFDDNGNPPTFTIDVVPACVYTAGSAAPLALATVGGTVQGSTSGDFDATGPCSNLTLSADTGSGTQIVPVSGGPGNFTFSLPNSGWVAGARTVTINGAFTSGGGPATWTITVTSPCTFGAVTNPSLVGGQVPLTMYGNGTLTSTSISFTTTGTCSTATLRLSAAAGNGATTSNGQSDNTWTASLPSSVWSTGSGQVVTVSATAGSIVTAAGGSPVAFPVNVTQECTVLVSPAPSPQSLVVLGNGDLQGPPAFATFTTGGSCSNLQMDIRSSAGGGTLGTGASNITVQSTGPNTWRAAIPNSGNFNYPLGSIFFNINNSFSPSGSGGGWTATTALPPCTFNAITSPALVGGQVPLVRFGNGTLQSSTAISFSTTGSCNGVTLRFDGPPGSGGTTTNGQSDNTWTANLIGTGWSSGAGQTVTITATSGSIVTGGGTSPVTFLVNVTQVCTVSGSPANPTAATVFGNGSLSSATPGSSWTFATTGTCAALSTTNGTATGTVTGAGPTFTGNLPTTGWATSGTPQVTVSNVFTSTGGAYQFNVTVTQACTLATSPAPTPGALPVTSTGFAGGGAPPVTFSVQGSCAAPLTLSLTNGPAGSPFAVVGAGTNRTSTLPASVWPNTGTTRVTVNNAFSSTGGPAFWDITLSSACQFNTWSAANPPTSVTVFGNGDLRTTPTPNASLTTTGSCPGSLTLRNTGGDTSTITGGGATKAGPIPNNAWVTNAANGAVSDTVTVVGLYTSAGTGVTFNLTITQACTVANGAPNADLDVVNNGAGQGNPVGPNPAAATFQSLGNCTGITFSQITIRRVGAGGTPATRTVSGGPVNWTTASAIPNPLPTNWVDNNETFNFAVSFGGAGAGAGVFLSSGTQLTSGTTTVWTMDTV